MREPDRKFTNFLINNFFKSKSIGFFIEAGANTGYAGSVCWLLEYNYNWTGMNIECNPYCYLSLVKRRPKCININKALSDKNRELTFTFPIDGPRKLFAGQGSTVFLPDHWNKRPTRQIKVKSVALKELIIKYKINNIDLLVLDVEGSEINALTGLDGSKIMPRVIVIEDDKIDIDKLNIIMKKWGFKEFSARYKNNRIYYK